MATDVQLIEKPLKYASRAMIIFAASAFVLGYLYEFLALSSISMPTSASWVEIRNLAGFSFERAIRYFAFFYISFLTFTCYERSSLKSSPWGVYILIAVFPAAMSFIPFLFSGEINFNASSYWAIEALLMSLLYLRNSTTMLRSYIIALICVLVLLDISGNIAGWGNAVQQQAVKIYGEVDSGRHTNSSFVWFAPAAAISALVQIYLIYWLPKKFFVEMGINEK